MNRNVLFAANFFKHPRALSTLFPSSRFVVRRTLAKVPWNECRTIVEYGPGVGHITTEILRQMRPDARLIGIELNSEFVEFLQATQQDERLQIVEASATEVRAVLKDLGYPGVDCVISGIPFSTLSPMARERIVTDTYAVLEEDGRLVTYQVSASVLPYLRSTFGRVNREILPLNLTPLQMFSCIKQTPRE
jgi:phospholipid N-methyltransferase